jgi:hypothetical protein
MVLRLFGQEFAFAGQNAGAAQRQAPARRAGTTPWAVRSIQLSFAGVLAMTEIDWTVVGSALLLVGWFGFLLLLLYFSLAT